MLMNEGEKLYWMITSMEKIQYQQILQFYYEWVEQCDALLLQFEQD